MIDHADDIPWWEMPIPARFHRCRPHTVGLAFGLGFVERCPCGGIRVRSGRWLEKNSRRRYARRGGL